MTEKITPSRNSARGRTGTRPKGYLFYYKPNASTRVLLQQVQSILDEYREYLPLTCRQIFYRLVGRFGFDKTENAYKNLCNHLVNFRRAELISFKDIRDDGIGVTENGDFADEAAFWEFVRTRAQQFQRNKLTNQPRHIEIWCEAAGMLPQLARVASPYSIKVYSSSGFDSLTAKRNIVDRICRISKPATIIHLGDYDPSGISIYEAAEDDVQAFVREDRPGPWVTVEFDRIALNRAQVYDYQLPTAPAKATDSRSKNWGNEGTCQLEALAPDQLAAILDAAIQPYIDFDILAGDRQQEIIERNRIAYALPSPAA